jgi:hypothetical protein
MLMTVGGLFALNNFTPYGIGSTWPILLIVFGLLTLACRSASPAPAPEAPQLPRPAYYPPQPPPPAYRQGPYSQPPAGAEKGGFGTSAPSRPAAPGQTTETPGGAS